MRCYINIGCRENFRRKDGRGRELAIPESILSLAEHPDDDTDSLIPVDIEREFIPAAGDVLVYTDHGRGFSLAGTVLERRTTVVRNGEAAPEHRLILTVRIADTHMEPII